MGTHGARKSAPKERPCHHATDFDVAQLPAPNVAKHVPRMQPVQPNPTLPEWHKADGLKLRALSEVRPNRRRDVWRAGSYAAVSCFAAPHGWQCLLFQRIRSSCIHCLFQQQLEHNGAVLVDLGHLKDAASPHRAL